MNDGNQLVFLFVGLGFVWAMLGVYVITLGRRQHALKREVERLERDLLSK